jgi:hypothetical protein
MGGRMPPRSHSPQRGVQRMKWGGECPPEVTPAPKGSVTKSLVETKLGDPSRPG